MTLISFYHCPYTEITDNLLNTSYMVNSVQNSNLKHYMKSIQISKSIKILSVSSHRRIIRHTLVLQTVCYLQFLLQPWGLTSLVITCSDTYSCGNKSTSTCQRILQSVTRQYHCMRLSATQVGRLAIEQHVQTERQC